MKIRTWHIAGAVFTMALGSLLHFAYEWSGFIPIFAVFGSVNESVWEHLKLLYWPYVLSTIAGFWIYGKNIHGYFAAKALGAVAGMFFITAAFYTYTGVIGRSFLWIDILLFALGDAAAYFVSYKKIKNSFRPSNLIDFLGMAVFLLFACMFCVFTFNPPSLGIFC